MQILYLMTKGEQFTSQEATTLFFNTTKLFQSPDVSTRSRCLRMCRADSVQPYLRRLIYLMIKELSSQVGTDESLIVVSCLSKVSAHARASGSVC